MAKRESDDGRLELAQFLRSRRSRLTPGQLGMPAVGRRRTPGLRREEVAVLAGVSRTWYTYLEQGRARDVSPSVLDSIARVLQFSEDERRYMHELAYGKVISPGPLIGDIPGDELVIRLVEAVMDTAYPVYASNLYCDIVAWNRAAREWYDDWGSLPPGRRNMIRWLLFSDVAKERLIDWEGDVRDIIARWRSMTSSRLADDRLQKLINEFKATSVYFTECWENHEVSEHRSRIRVFRHPRLGVTRMRGIVVESPEFTPSFVVFHVPQE
jgi:transcriptional regulator with XRE-family HTH domain